VNRRFAISAVVLVALLASSVLPSIADELQNDFDRLQGNWTLFYAEVDGFSFLSAASVRLSVRDNRYLMAPNTPAAILGQFALGQMNWPKEIDYTLLTGPNAGQTMLGVYNITGAVHTTCFAPPGQPRPTDFSTFPGSGRILNVWLKLR
jgi:uncharacterized protein (TIGR03067 family)